MLESVAGSSAVIVPMPGGVAGAAAGFGASMADASLAFEVLTPAYVARRLESRIGQSVTLHTKVYLESQNQGSSFEPRLIGFLSPVEREFFDLFTTVKGIGNRKALRALAEDPAVIASAIARADAKALTNLPEIGKRMADTVIAELKGKTERYMSVEMDDGTRTIARPAAVNASGANLSVPEQEAVDTLVVLGEQRSEAERKVRLAAAKLGRPAVDVNELVGAVYSLR